MMGSTHMFLTPVKQYMYVVKIHTQYILFRLEICISFKILTHENHENNCARI